MPVPTFTIQPCKSASDISAATALFIAYTTSLNLDLGFQDLATELASMPGKYATSQGGSLLLARDLVTSEALGAVALRALAPRQTPSHPANGERKVCEMKRLYVAPAGRGKGVGKALAEAVLLDAVELGYDEVKLDTLPHMSSARGLYESLGFGRCERYYETPLKETIFMSKEL